VYRISSKRHEIYSGQNEKQRHELLYTKISGVYSTTMISINIPMLAHMPPYLLLQSPVICPSGSRATAPESVTTGWV
jgi:hypothetical protein